MPPARHNRPRMPRLAQGCRERTGAIFSAPAILPSTTPCTSEGLPAFKRPVCTVSVSFLGPVFACLMGNRLLTVSVTSTRVAAPIKAAAILPTAVRKFIVVYQSQSQAHQKRVHRFGLVQLPPACEDRA